jgi:hypothetical protein
MGIAWQYITNRYGCSCTWSALLAVKVKITLLPAIRGSVADGLVIPTLAGGTGTGAVTVALLFPGVNLLLEIVAVLA